MKITIKNKNISNIKNYKKCTNPTKINYCQDKSSGGHPDTIFSTNKKTCIKKISFINNEIIFYNKHNQLVKNGITVLENYIPFYNGICKLNDKKYFQMENLKKLFKQPLSIDIKIGYQTASKFIIKKKTKKLYKIYSKLIKHYILDKYITKTGKNGFRIEGVSLPNNIKLNKLKIMRSNYKTIFDYYFINDIDNIIINKFIDKLKELSKTIENDNFNKYYFMGASILFVYDGLNLNNDPILKLIDFENSLILDNDIDIKKKLNHANNIRKSIKSLIVILTNYLHKKIENTKY
jgi:hypothetical protein